MACRRRGLMAVGLFLLAVAYTLPGANAESPTLRCRGFDGSNYVLDVEHSKVYDVFSAKHHKLNALFESRASSGASEPTIVIPELGLVYNDPDSEPVRIHARALSNGTLEVHVNNRKYMEQAMLQGNLEVFPCPPEDLETLELRGQPDFVVTVATPLITLYAWAKPAADAKDASGEVLLRLIVNEPGSHEGDFTGILGSTMNHVLEPEEGAERSSHHAPAPSRTSGGKTPSNRHLGEQRAAGDNLVEAKPFAQSALFTGHAHDEFPVRGSYSSARRLMNVHGWLNGHIGGLLPPRRHSLTRRNLRAQNKPVSSKDAYTSKQGGEANSQMKLSQKLDNPYTILADPVTHAQPGNKQLGVAPSTRPDQLESPYLTDSTNPIDTEGNVRGTADESDSYMPWKEQHWMHPGMSRDVANPYFTLYGQMYDPQE